jgi:predicted TIM-barrel fold metal-dependent hydrolase
MAGVFERFPGLKLVMTENTAAWSIERRQFLDQWYDAASVPGTLAHIFGNDALSKLKKRPGEYMRSNVYYGTFLTPEDIEQRYEIGLDRIMWGADFPHHEGTSPYTTRALRSNFAGLPEAEVRAMLAQNSIDLYGFDLPLLQQVADRIGPTVAEVDVPLSDDEVPRFPDESMCPTFAAAAWQRPDDR